LAALRTEIPYPVAYFLVLGHDLVRAVLKHQTLVGRLRQPSRAEGRQEQDENEQETGGRHSRVITLDEMAKTMFAALYF
jgi:hypothetical protein